MSLRDMIRSGSTGLLLCAALLSGLQPARADLTPLTLYQRCGRSPWVIVADVADGNDRFAELRVVEILKGEYDRETLRVVHRLENFLRKTWEGKIEFKTGERVVLFLKRYDPEETDGSKVPDKLSVEDMFASTFGAMGVFTLPAEGEEAYLAAVREFSRATAIQDPVEQEEAVLAFLKSSNPHVLQAGLEQVRDRRLAFEPHVPLLMDLVEHPREPIRLNALQILAHVADDLRAAGKRLAQQDNLVDRLKGKVLSDESDLFRTEALRVVILLGGKGEAEFFRRVSKEDPSQLVRYEASRALLELNR